MAGIRASRARSAYDIIAAMTFRSLRSPNLRAGWVDQDRQPQRGHEVVVCADLEWAELEITVRVRLEFVVLQLARHRRRFGMIGQQFDAAGLEQHL